MLTSKFGNCHQQVYGVATKGESQAMVLVTRDLSADFARIGCRENQQNFEALATDPSRGHGELSPKVAKEQSLKLGRALFGHSARRRTSPVSLGADRRNILLTMKLGDGQARDGFCHRRQRRQNLVSKRHFYRDW